MSPDAARIDGLSRMRCLVHRASPAGHGHGHDRGLRSASIAGSDYRRPAKPAITGNTENPSAARTTYDGWWLNRRAIASRSAADHAIPIPGGSTLPRSQTAPKTLPEIPKIPKIKSGCRKSPRLADRRTTLRGTEQFSESKDWPRDRRYNATSNLSRSLSRIPWPGDSGVTTLLSGVLLSQSRGASRRQHEKRVAQTAERSGTRTKCIAKAEPRQRPIRWERLLQHASRKCRNCPNLEKPRRNGHRTRS